MTLPTLFRWCLRQERGGTSDEVIPGPVKPLLYVRGQALSWIRSSWQGRREPARRSLRCKSPQKVDDGLLQFLAVNNAVYHPVIQDEFRPLETLGKLLP